MARTRPRVLVATDFSPGSAAAARRLATLWPAGARPRVHLLHVLEPLAFAVPAGGFWVGYERDRTREARSALERAAGRLKRQLGPGATVETHVIAGPVHAEICRMAGELDADLVVVGTHGRTGLEHVIIGSVAERVVRHAGRPVLTVPLRTAPKRRRR
jgi:nucleotide-binding universal stress UspA family protein